MATELNSLVDNTNATIVASALCGGETRGRVLQLRQQQEGYHADAIQLTEQQVKEAIATMQAWLDNNY